MENTKIARPILLYILCILKLFNTIITFQDWIVLNYPMVQDLSLYGSIVSFPSFLGFMFYEEVAVWCVVALITAAVIWSLLLPTAMLGIKFKPFCRFSIVLILVANILDLIASLISVSLQVKIFSGGIAAIMILLSARCLRNLSFEKK